jgi:predicted nucleic acid-binding protein
MESALLVDSSFFIELLQKGLDPGTELLRRVELLDLATCGMIRLEVVRGIAAPKLRARVEDFMSVMVNVPTDNKLWMEATQIAWDLGREGWTMPAADILIAASAFRINAAVLTLDKHFSAIPGLTVYRSLDELH